MMVSLMGIPLPGDTSSLHTNSILASVIGLLCGIEDPDISKSIVFVTVHIRIQILQSFLHIFALYNASDLYLQCSYGIFVLEEDRI